MLLRPAPHLVPLSGHSRGKVAAGLKALVWAQTLAALADAALLMVAVAALLQQGLPAAWPPLLKVSFSLAYVVWAPWAGLWADRWSAPVWMAGLHGIKLTAVLAWCLGLHPLATLALIGSVSALYAPAKLGWLTRHVQGQALVQANAWLKGSLVAAALLGAGLGGLLISPAWSQAVLALPPLSPSLPASLWSALAMLAALYLAAAWFSLCVPESSAHCPPLSSASWHTVGQDLATLWADPSARTTLGATGLIWSVSAVLQFLLLAWGVQGLGLDLHQAAWLQGAVALGLILGATLAGRWADLRQATAALAWGPVLAGLLLVLSLGSHWVWSLGWLLLCGLAGGAMVVPLNAKLQQCGAACLPSGRAIAAQGLFQNLCALLLLLVYAGLQAMGTPLVLIMGALAAWVLGVSSRLIRQAPAPTQTGCT